MFCLKHELYVDYIIYRILYKDLFKLKDCQKVIDCLVTEPLEELEDLAGIRTRAGGAETHNTIQTMLQGQA